MLTFSDPGEVWIFRKNHDGKWTWQLLSPQEGWLIRPPSGSLSMDDCTKDASEQGHTTTLEQLVRRGL